VQESIRFDGVHIGRGAWMRRAILDHGTAVPPGTRISFKYNHFQQPSKGERRRSGGIMTAKETPDARLGDA
jgi:ADP-glucose pyrophosphorylase